MTDNIANQEIVSSATYGPANELQSLNGGSAAVVDDLYSNESNANDVSFVGGHFNLTLTAQQVTDLGNGADAVIAALTSSPSAIGRGYRYALTVGLPDGENLHVNVNGSQGYTFHIDLNNPNDVVGIVKHVGQEMIGGHWPFNHCLDPAFQN